ncbi:DUF305 domain-containing protein [Aquabacterium sp. A7-Y]|uniref:DUF305 domain-containing protein n=1 Tax=Aquabacterium sp. A7-Y TaxID=1349605 RepID=UPI00223E786B|nr:DUF305 domain-containing protein [Aquabacterium sp. A7-Y]MCW7541442.1 DUF305 domain-containing protein [Aquabacterium sp. A7-Y]
MNPHLTRSFRWALCPLVIAAGLASGAALAQSAPHGSDPMHQSMMSGMQAMQDMKPTGDTDKDFATMMKMHHQQALDMAKAELEHGKSPEMKAMAQKIIKDQTKEIQKLDSWLEKQK